LVDEIKKNEIGWACGTYMMRTGFWWVDPRQGNDLEDLGVDGRIILK
jgi:hypothetical protein